jgi:hypothetical protein
VPANNSNFSAEKYAGSLDTRQLMFVSLLPLISQSSADVAMGDEGTLRVGDVGSLRFFYELSRGLGVPLHVRA